MKDHVFSLHAAQDRSLQTSLQTGPSVVKRFELLVGKFGENDRAGDSVAVLRSDASKQNEFDSAVTGEATVLDWEIEHDTGATMRHQVFGELYLPTLEEIRHECQLIQTEWTEEERISRGRGWAKGNGRVRRSPAGVERRKVAKGM
jgi:hypothetical protein